MVWSTTLKGAALVALAQSAQAQYDSSPPKYPSPWGTGSGDWADAYAKARAFVSDLTLLEKVNLTTGTGWEGEACVGNTGGIPSKDFAPFCLQDSPTGVRDTDYNSAFPAGVNVAATFSRSMAYMRGLAMGQEFNDKGVDVALGPVAGPLGRAPEGGRNWEGFAPDPYITGQLLAESVKGIQDAGVIACAKHFIGNEQEHFRQQSEAATWGDTIAAAYSANIDDKTMHELYLWPFADAVRAGVGSIMCSYNQLNQSYACANSYLLNYILKNELDFQGFVVSDWAAQHSGVETVFAGLDMTMPGDDSFESGHTFWGTNLTVALLNGTVPEWRLDDMATRIMAAYYKVDRDSHRVPVNFQSWTLDTYGYQHALAELDYGVVNQHVDVRGDHKNIIREIGAASAVLLKNDGALPLTGKEKFTAVFGEDSVSNPYGVNGCSDRGCDNGTVAMGWGSGTAAFPYVVTPEIAITNEVLANGGVVQTLSDNWAMSQMEALAAQASVCLVFVEADAGEGYIEVDGNIGDRNNLTLWKNGDAMIQNVSANCNNTVVVMHTVGAVLVDEWYDNDNITAIIWAGLPGQETGNSIVDVLYGKVNPAGRSPFTWGKTRESYGTDVMYKQNNGEGAPQLNFTEGSLIDYRYFDAKNETPIYEFGYGLSYTSFSYSNLTVTPTGAGAYVPTNGTTTAAPVLGNFSTDPADYLFPNDSFRYVPLYVYPYLNSTDLSEASEDTDYGMASEDYLPSGFNDSSPQPLLPAGGAPGGNAQLWDVLYEVTATITNTGGVAGDEVPQLYVSLGGDNPPVQLRGFDRITIPAGGSAVFSACLTRRDLSNWDTESQNWVITDDAKTIYVGKSSRKLELSYDLPSASTYGSVKREFNTNEKLALKARYESEQLGEGVVY